MSNLPEEPKRPIYDWDNAMMGNCGCGHWKRLVPTANGYSCADCIDAEHHAAWRAYARQLRALLESRRDRTKITSRYVLRQIVNGFPTHRDWLDPELERMARAVLADDLPDTIAAQEGISE